MKQTKINEILTVLNSTNDLGFKYPIGNKELTAKVRELESNGLIHYKAIERKWIAIKKPSVFFTTNGNKNN